MTQFRGSILNAGCRKNSDLPVYVLFLALYYIPLGQNDCEEENVGPHREITVKHQYQTQKVVELPSGTTEN